MSALLQVRGLTKRFGGLRAVDDLEFTVDSGQIVGLIGPNGAGKTTVFNLISGSIRPDHGNISLDGRDIAGWSPHRVCRAGLARTFQVVRPFGSLTVVDNVLVGAVGGGASDAESWPIVEETLEFVGLTALAGTRAGALSLMNLKRLEVARALASRPKLMLLDEVFAGLTPRELPEAVKLVKNIRERGVAIVVIEHLMQVVMELSEHVVVLHHGQQLASGSPDHVVHDTSVIAAYLGTEYLDATGE